jgi:U4/U6 small nuclear ribonucleoprotein SNU13
MKQGATKVVKTLKSGMADLVILAADAADTFPLAVIAVIPLLGEDKNVNYVYVESKTALRRACGSSRDVVAVSITVNESSQLNGTVKKVKDEMEKLFV